MNNYRYEIVIGLPDTEHIKNHTKTITGYAETFSIAKGHIDKELLLIPADSVIRRVSIFDIDNNSKIILGDYMGINPAYVLGIPCLADYMDDTYI